MKPKETPPSEMGMQGEGCEEEKEEKKEEGVHGILLGMPPGEAVIFDCLIAPEGERMDALRRLIDFAQQHRKITEEKRFTGDEVRWNLSINAHILGGHTERLRQMAQEMLDKELVQNPDVNIVEIKKKILGQIEEKFAEK